MTKIKKIVYVMLTLALVSSVLYIFKPSPIKITDVSEAVLPQVSSFRENVLGVVGSTSPMEDKSYTDFSHFVQNVEVSVNGVTVPLTWETVDGKNSLTTGQKVVLGFNTNKEGTEYTIVDTFRLPSLVVIIFICIILAAIISGKYIVPAIGSLLFSAWVIVYFIAPGLLSPRPYIFLITGAAVIGVVGVYVTHGINKVSNAAAVSVSCSLLIAIGMSFLVTSMVGLNGQGTEQAGFLQAFSGLSSLKGVLLATIVLGVLGVLDDAAITQAESVAQLKLANRMLSKKQLYSASMKIGKKHIASLINTLFLAYISTSVPLLLLLVLAPVPLWVVLNSQVVVEEVVRTLIGTMSLMCCIPISSAVASYTME